MDKIELERYIKEKGKVTIPDVQTEFSLGYKEARELFAALEKMSVIRLENDLNFVHCKTVSPFPKGERMSFADYVASMPEKFNSYELQMLKTLIESKHPIYKSVVKFCAERPTVSVSLLQKRYHIGYALATQIMDWLAEKHVVIKDGLQYKVRINEDNYCEMFGDDDDEDEFLYNEDDDDEDDFEDDEIKSDLEKARAKIRAAFRERERTEMLRQEILQRMRDHSEEDDEDDDEDDVEGGDDKLDVSALTEDATKKRPWASAHRSFIERYQQELMQRVKEYKEADTEDELFDDDDSFDLDLSDSRDGDIEAFDDDCDDDCDSDDEDDCDSDDEGDIETALHNMWNDDEDLGKECFDLLEKIIGTNILITRQDAIQEVENRLDIALKGSESPLETKVLEGLYGELLSATDEDFTKFKQAIFDSQE